MRLKQLQVGLGREDELGLSEVHVGHMTTVSVVTGENKLKEKHHFADFFKFFINISLAGG